MKKIDQATARALVRLRNLPEFRTYRAWLESSLTDTDIRLRTSEGTQLAQHQGEAQCLAEQIEKIERADTIAAKFENSGR